MDFDGNLPGTRYPPAHDDIVDQDFHDFACQMLRMDIPLDQFPAIVAAGNSFVNFGKLLPIIQNRPFQPLLFPQRGLG